MGRKKKFNIDSSYVIDQYKNHRRSTSAIADELGTYPIVIRRVLKANNVKLRSKSEAQKINLKNNGHPMSGKSQPKKVKNKISKTVKRYNKKSKKNR